MRHAFLAVMAWAAVGQEPRFDVQARLVLVPVSVTDVAGATADGLEARDFTLLDNGRAQTVTADTIGTGVAPIALVMAVQSSGISKPVLEKLDKVGAMIQPLITGERGCAAVVAFSDEVQWLQECTADTDAIERSLARIRPGTPKKARMLDAVNQAIEHLSQHRNSRRVLLLISESRDRGSEATLDQVMPALEAAGITVYAATYSALKTAFTTKSSAIAEPEMEKRPRKPGDDTGTVTGAPPSCGPHGCVAPLVPKSDQRADILGVFGELARLGKTDTTRTMVEGTGGTTFPFARLKGLEQALMKLGSELHSQYVLSFVPDDRTPGYHRLEVRTSNPLLLVRARPGYWSLQGP